MMHNRLVVALVFLFASVFSGYGLSPAHASFCTVGDIVGWLEQGVPPQEIAQECNDLDVDPNKCNAQDIMYLYGSGYTLSDIYYECR